MKTLIYFFSCLLLYLPHLANAQIFGKSPEEKCFDAQMKIWDATPIEEYLVRNKPSGDTYKSIVGYPGNMRFDIESKDYWLSWDGKKLDAKAKFEADAWARCMKK
jgi:hypothetical protein